MITREELENLKTEKGGYTRKTIESIGLSYPPPKGWKKKILKKIKELEDYKTRDLNRKQDSSDLAYSQWANGNHKIKKKKYYVIWEGHEIGIATSWDKCKEYTDGYKGAKYKSYTDLREAEQAFEEGAAKHWGQKKKHTNKPEKSKQKPYVKDSLVSFNIEEIIDHINEYFDKGSKEYIKSRI